MADNFCIIMPAFQEEARIAEVVKNVRSLYPQLVVVDDGSTDKTADVAEGAGAVVLRHPTNLGKGAAIRTGFQYAREKGCEFVIAMDGDGQHDPGDIAGFLREYRATHAAVILGSRMDDPEGMPTVRRLTNRFMSWLLSLRMGQRVPDTQCGFRLYRCDTEPPVTARCERFDYDSEVLLQYAMEGFKIGSVPVKVIYGEEKSKIRPLRDTIRFFRMLASYRARESSGKNHQMEGPS